MSDPEVTITLGRTGQVVTKGGKRSRGERFRSNGDGLFLSANKRQRGDGVKWTPGLDGANGSRIARNDLRLKLMRKRLSKQHAAVEEHEKMQPRKRLLKGIQHQTSSYLLPQGPEPSESNHTRQMLSKRIQNDLHQVDSPGKFYSSQTIGGSRARSPDRILRSSSRLSPPRSFTEMRQVASMREADVYRGGHLLRSEVIDASRLTSSMPTTMKATPQIGNAIARAAVAPTSGIMHNVPYMGDEPLTVAGFLHSLGLRKYAVLFQAEEIDMTVLKQMGDKDLKEMGIPMGPRKKILLAILPHQKRQTLSIQH